MAAPKKKTEDDVPAEVEVDDSNRSVTGRPNDLPIVTHAHPLPNSTFAERAKAAGRNKRVAESDSK